MGQFLLLVVVALTVGAIVFGVTVLLTGGDRGLSSAEPDGRAVPLPGTRPLVESDIAQVRFDTAWRGYRMAQVDQAMRRAAYDVGYKDELINVLEAEVEALRAGRFSDAEVLRRAREVARDTTSSDLPAPVAATEGQEVAVIDLTPDARPAGRQSGAEPAEESGPEPVREAAATGDSDGTGSTGTSGDSGDADPGTPTDPDNPVESEPPIEPANPADPEGPPEPAGLPGGDRDEPAAQDDTGNGSDAPESDSVLPSRR
jgi:DivIVA domain-containing protein